MKQSIILFICLIGNTLNAQHQNNGAVVYKFNHLRDTVSSLFYEEEMVLYFSIKNTAYKSFTGMKQDSIISSQVEKNLQAGGRMHLGKIKSTTKQNYFRDLAQNRAFIESMVSEDMFMYEDSVKPIFWKLLSEEKKIGGVVCKAAKTNYLGRNYQVWYAPDIPISGGPWKLYGLPGLILEAKDEKNQVSFVFNGFIPAKNTDELHPNKSSIKTTRQDFLKMLEALRHNPQLANNSLPISISTSGKQNLPAYNNPLELE